MGKISILAGILSVLGVVAFFLLGWGSSAIYWLSLALGLCALGFGFMTRNSMPGKTGIALGLLGVIPTLLLIGWLHFMVGA